ncbi:MAG: 3-keto-5-aminohexanoate cleavage protein [Hyphomicrobiaceae bacterium]|nr:3-keto-5-aminohexanoate cleavage protein [Hyphomicrobiaceae bacterium]
MSRKVVITCALTGSQDTCGKNPAVPASPEEIATSAIDAANAGASVVHIHVRDPETRLASMEEHLYAETVERIRDSGTNVIVNLTTGPGARFVPGKDDPAVPDPTTTLKTPAERVKHVLALKPPICTLDVASFNFGEQVFVNTPEHLREMGDIITAAGVKPELEVFDTGHIVLAKRLLADGHVKEPPLFQICLGISYAAPAAPESLLHMRDMLPENAVWSAFGISQHQFPIVAATVISGGHVRVGLEDNLYMERGVLAPSNAALVERAVRIIREIGAEVASPDEARGIFGV